MGRLSVRRAAACTQLVEAIASGFAFGALLWWGGSCLVGVFRPQDLAMPYWSGLPHFRTDTSGFAAFVVAFFCITVSEYLRLRRRHDTWRRACEARYLGAAEGQGLSGRPAEVLLHAGCTALALMATGLVVYLSLNTVTHPVTQNMQATHLLSWPTEGSLRMVALACCVIAVSLLRFLRVSRRDLL